MADIVLLAAVDVLLLAGTAQPRDVTVDAALGNDVVMRSTGWLAVDVDAGPPVTPVVRDAWGDGSSEAEVLDGGDSAILLFQAFYPEGAADAEGEIDGVALRNSFEPWGGASSEGEVDEELLPHLVTPWGGGDAEGEVDYELRQLAIGTWAAGGSEGEVSYTLNQSTATVGAGGSSGEVAAVVAWALRVRASTRSVPQRDALRVLQRGGFLRGPVTSAPPRAPVAGGRVFGDRGPVNPRGS